MAADLYKMQDDQRFPEIRIDKSNLTRSVLQLQYCDDFVAVHFAIFHKAQGTV